MTKSTGSSTFQACGDALLSVFEAIETRGQRGIETGFLELDDMMNGLQPAELIVIGSRPSMGKSAFASNIVEHVAADSLIPTAVVTLEMTAEQYMQRMIASRAQINAHKIRRGMMEAHEYAQLAKVTGELAENAPLFIHSAPRLYIDTLEEIAREIVLAHNAKLLVIDYVQLVGAEGANRTEQLTTISRRLKALAMEFRIPVIALSQLNRGMFQPETPRPRFEDLRGSGTLEDEADVVILVHREDYYRKQREAALDFVPDNIAEIVIAKQRNGPTGTIKLSYMDKTTRFENLSTFDPF